MPIWTASPELNFPSNLEVSYKPNYTDSFDIESDMVFTPNTDSLDVSYHLVDVQALDLYLRRTKEDYIPDFIPDLFSYSEGSIEHEEAIQKSIGKAVKLSTALSVEGSQDMMVPVLGGHRIKFEIVTGRHRFRLFRKLGLKYIPVGIEPNVLSLVQSTGVLFNAD